MDMNFSLVLYNSVRCHEETQAIGGGGRSTDNFFLSSESEESKV
tara:strand:+ start:340 stop:471 length:132 start_codon:yes stop_codon:yes gene_type:complete